MGYRGVISMSILSTYAASGSTNMVTDLLEKVGADTLNKQYLALALAAVAVIAVVFIVAVIISLFGKSKKLVKRFDEVGMYIDSEGGSIDESKLDGLYSFIQQLPQPVVDGWGNFLGQQLGYPSDYISDSNVLADPAFSGKKNSSSMFFSILSVIVIAAFAYLGSTICPALTDDVLSTQGIIINTMFDLISVIAFPIIAYAVGLAFLSLIHTLQTKKLTKAYKNMKDALDDGVTVTSENLDETEEDGEDKPYIPGKPEKIDVLDEEVEKIIASKIEQNELIEIVTTPRMQEREEVAAAAMPTPTVERRAALDLSDIQLEASDIDTIELPTPETIFNDDLSLDNAHFVVPDIKAEEPLPEGVTIPSTPEKESRLQALVGIVNNAIEDMEGTTKDDLKELASSIKEAKSDEAFRDPKDQAVLDECLYKLMDLIYPTDNV